MHSIAALHPTANVLARFEDLSVSVQREVSILLENMTRNECNTMKHLLRSVGAASSLHVSRSDAEDAIAEDVETDAQWENDADEISAILARFYGHTSPRRA